ncbi:cation-translocating P-type ATPase [Levilactobacillus bambusae]|uniref:Magnesium-transporting ATPase n=1 Tax=Levilactobacillus bambusae TaxID=2024736 RepID=A0A2V1N0I6_9LACO|nr:cation-translocating P-type ATPase [Levilactobacillus bambusae]PWF99859.1 magnesium-transporting ATPase [Levilactobacillus bambusae]
MEKSKQEPTNLATGLTTSEVQQRVASGQQNDALPPLTRSVKQIFRDNVFTLFNAINLVLGALVLVTGSYKNLLFLGVAVVNTAIGIYQEIRSKHQIDEMTLLSEGVMTVRRDGQPLEVRQEEVVLGDLLLLGRGDQVPVDGIVRETTGIEVDESQITGESDSIFKQTGDAVTSGSILMSGQAVIQATAVGENSFVKRLSTEAKHEKQSASQLLATINRIIKILTYTIIPLGAILFASKMLHGNDLNQSILGTVAAMVGMIPEGLVLLTSVALAAGAVTLARKHVLVRDLPAIEALARVDVLCLDKTGTITSGRLKLAAVKPLGPLDEGGQKQALSAIVRATEDTNETAMALQSALPEVNWAVDSVMPFSSERKWSGAKFRDHGIFVMGAPEFIFSPVPDGVTEQINGYAEAGDRVLSLATAEDVRDHQLVNPTLQGLVLISDELRPNAKSTLRYFKNQDVSLRVISGDNPATVASIAKRAGLDGADQFVNMSQITDEADDGQYDDLVAHETIFGRVTPAQKKRLIAAFQRAGHTVAMTGDGVNDILAMRQSDCSVAMASGSEATKSIADFVLLDSNFDAMINVLNEGRRVINNIERVASLYLIKTMYSVMLTLIFIFMTRSYPFQPIQLTPISVLTVGIPTFFLALEPNYQRLTGQFMEKVMQIAAPAAICDVGYILVIMYLGDLLALNYTQTSTLSVMFTGVIGLFALLLVARPLNRLKIGLVTLMAVCFVSIFVWGGPLFSLASIFNWKMAVIYVPLLISAYPVYYLVQGILGKRVFSKIHWR